MSNNKQLRDNLRKAYDRHSQEREFGGVSDWKITERAHFLTMLQQEQKESLLEIGAGPGKDSLFFKKKGLYVEATDLSSEMVKLCLQKGLSARVMDMGDIQFQENSFDAVYSLNSMLHLTKIEFPIVLQQISRVLKPDGIFYLGMHGGNESEGVWDEDTYTPKRFFSFYSDDHLQQVIAKTFELLYFKSISTETDSSIHFQSCILRKKSNE
ncbi:class I SAM-dependent methyltransferase [Chloroflexota bacterium]